MRSFGAVFCCGFISTARNFGGRPYRRMLSTNSRTAQMWIHALKACARSNRLHTAPLSAPGPLADALPPQAAAVAAEHTCIKASRAALELPCARHLAVGGGAPLLHLPPLAVGLLAQAVPGRALGLLRLLRLAVLAHLRPRPRRLTQPGCKPASALLCSRRLPTASMENCCTGVRAACITTDSESPHGLGQRGAARRRAWKPLARAAALKPSATRLKRVTENSARSESSAISFDERGTCVQHAF